MIEIRHNALKCIFLFIHYVPDQCKKDGTYYNEKYIKGHKYHPQNWRQASFFSEKKKKLLKLFL